MWLALTLSLLISVAQYAKCNVLAEYEELSRDILYPPEDHTAAALPVEVGKDETSGCICRSTKSRRVIVCFGNYECKRFPKHPMFVSDCALLSVSSALGQLLIYRTIARFGPVVFTIIMTLRQAVSILVSCAVFGHAISPLGALGIVLVFGAVLLRVRCRSRAPAPPAAPPA